MGERVKKFQKPDESFMDEIISQIDSGIRELNRIKVDIANYRSLVDEYEQVATNSGRLTYFIEKGTAVLGIHHEDIGLIEIVGDGSKMILGCGGDRERALAAFQSFEKSAMAIKKYYAEGGE